MVCSINRFLASIRSFLFSKIKKIYTTYAIFWFCVYSFTNIRELEVESNND